MSISSVSSNSLWSQYYSSSTSTSSSQKTGTSNLVDKLFSQLDTKGQGYLEVSDFESAFSQLSSSTSDEASADEVFSSLDSDGDGKITKDEMSSNLEKLAETLNSQFDAMRVGSGMPPPPPPAGGMGDEEDEGYSQDELSEIASSTDDSNLSTLMSTLASNFDAADTNGDGKVNREEAMAYQASVSGTDTTEQMAMGPMNGMPPPPPPGGSDEDDQGFTVDELSEIASSTDDSNLSTLMSTLASNFDAADTNGDGRVTRAEAMAYQDSTQGSSTQQAAVNSSNNEEAIMKRIMELVQAYGTSGDNTSSLLSISA